MQRAKADKEYDRLREQHANGQSRWDRHHHILPHDDCLQDARDERIYRREFEAGACHTASAAKATFLGFCDAHGLDKLRCWSALVYQPPVLLVRATQPAADAERVRVPEPSPQRDARTDTHRPVTDGTANLVRPTPLTARNLASAASARQSSALSSDRSCASGSTSEAGGWTAERSAHVDHSLASITICDRTEGVITRDVLVDGQPVDIPQRVFPSDFEDKVDQVFKSGGFTSEQRVAVRDQCAAHWVCQPEDDAARASSDASEDHGSDEFLPPEPSVDSRQSDGYPVDSGQCTPSSRSMSPSLALQGALLVYDADDDRCTPSQRSPSPALSHHDVDCLQDEALIYGYDDDQEACYYGDEPIEPEPPPMSDGDEFYDDYE